MSHYAYLIVGGGMTAAAAVNGIREIDANGSIGLFSMESDPPYDRPPLSKGLWKGTALETVWRLLEKHGIEIHLGCKVRSINPRLKQIIDDNGTFHTFDKLPWQLVARPGNSPLEQTRLFIFALWKITGACTRLRTGVNVLLSSAAALLVRRLPLLWR